MNVIARDERERELRARVTQQKFFGNELSACKKADFTRSSAFHRLTRVQLHSDINQRATCDAALDTVIHNSATSLTPN